MAPKLYMLPPSPPVRATLMTAKALGVDLELIPIDLFKQEHLTPEFLKLNPQHTVPTLDDNGFVIWDSHAINIYLVEKYGKDDSLYPKDPEIQAIIHQRLHFDSGVLTPAGLNLMRPIMKEGAKSVSPENVAAATENCCILEKLLEGRRWAAGDSVTLADFSLIASITSLNVLVPIDEGKFPNITAWIKRAQALPYYDANQNGLNVFTKMVQGLLKS